MNRIFNLVLGVGTALALTAGSAFAATYTLEPWVYPEGTDDAVAYVEDGTLFLEKNVQTSDPVAAGAEVQGVEGLSTTDMTLGFTVEDDGYCGAGAPRFNVYLENGGTIFLGCLHGDADNDGTVIFEAGETYGGVLFPEGDTVTGIEIVMDEEGQTALSNILVNGDEAVFVETNLPTSKDDCKKGGYQDLTDADGNSFKNQGQCVSYFNHL